MGISFPSMLAYIYNYPNANICLTKLLRKIQSTSGNGPSSLTQLYDTEVASLPNCLSAHSFFSWNAIGCKFAAIAAGGSIYLLMIITELELHWHISELAGQVCICSDLYIFCSKTSKMTYILDHESFV